MKNTELVLKKQPTHFYKQIIVIKKSLTKDCFSVNTYFKIKSVMMQFHKYTTCTFISCTKPFKYIPSSPYNSHVRQASNVLLQALQREACLSRIPHSQPLQHCLNVDIINLFHLQIRFNHFYSWARMLIYSHQSKLPRLPKLHHISPVFTLMSQLYHIMYRNREISQETSSYVAIT